MAGEAHPQNFFRPKHQPASPKRRWLQTATHFRKKQTAEKNKMSKAQMPGSRRIKKQAANHLQLSLFVGEYDVPVRCDVSVDRVRIDVGVRKTTRARPEVGVLYFLHIVPRLSVRGDAVNSVHSTLTRIVRRQGQVEVAVVSF